MPTFFKGRKRDLDNNDLYRVLPDHKSSTLGTWLTEAWQRQLDGQRRNGREPSLLRALLSVFGWRIALLGSLLFSIEVLIRYGIYVSLCGARSGVNKALCRLLCSFKNAFIYVFVMCKYVNQKKHRRIV